MQKYQELAKRIVWWAYTNCSLTLLLFLFLSFPISQAVYGGWFNETTKASGFDYTGPSFGASWGDMNGDGWPDLWVGNHAQPPILYMNNQIGGFSKTVNFQLSINSDMHGAAWADFDNDGDQDLLVQAGARSGFGLGPNQFLINSNSILIDEAKKYRLDYSRGRGRTPLWVDWDANGLLDVVLNNDKRPDRAAPTALFELSGPSFQDATQFTGLDSSSLGSFAQLISINGFQKPAIMIAGNPFPNRIFDTSSAPFVDLMANNLFPDRLWNVRDSAVADFNGDTVDDVFLARMKSSSRAVIKNKQIFARINVLGDEKEIKFKSQGELQISINPPFSLSPNSVFIGQQGGHPADLVLTLSPGSAGVTGVYPHIAGFSKGIFISYDPATKYWSLKVSNRGWLDSSIVINSGSLISDLSTSGFSNEAIAGGLDDKLLIQTNNMFEDRTVFSGLSGNTECVSAAAADFDNDMDVDIYLVCQSPIGNTPNLLYENIGNGVFQEVANSGANGSLFGSGESVAAADYDQDGFIDLFVTNGDGLEPYNSGPSQLYRNNGNSNHWIEIDLVGAISNVDAVGAVVKVKTGTKTQVRRQFGGMHNRSQDYKRLHFGLGGNAVVDSIIVVWPSGVTQELSIVAANQILKIVEPSVPSLKGRPDYRPGLDTGVYIWKDTFDGPYHLRTVGGSRAVRYNINIITDGQISNVLPHALASSDNLNWNSNSIFLESFVSNYEDGITFNISKKANTFISVEKDDVPYTNINYGEAGSDGSPVGWIGKIEDFPGSPSFSPGNELGLFIGSNTALQKTEVRWNGDGKLHLHEVVLVASSQLFNVETVSFDTSDSISIRDNGLSAQGYTSSGWDGLNFSVIPGSILAFKYTQDGLINTNNVSLNDNSISSNALLIPSPNPYGSPKYDATYEAGIFLWKDEVSNTWKLRATAGGGNSQYTGRLVSSTSFLNVASINIESNDVVNNSNSNVILFDLKVTSRWEDGIDFRLPAGANLSLIIDNNQGSTPFIGADRWPIQGVNIDLSGW